MGQLSLNRVKANRDVRKAKSNRGGSFWKCGPGVNRVRLVLFPSSVTGNEEYCREIEVHQERGTQPVICGKSADRFGVVGEDCPECDRARTVFNEDGKEAAKGMWARGRTAFLIVPLEKASAPFKNPKLYPFWAAKSVAGAIDSILADCDECADVRDYFGPDGLDFKITFDPKASPMEMYKVKVMPKVKCETLDASVFEGGAEADLYLSDELEPTGWVNPYPTLTEGDAQADLDGTERPDNPGVNTTSPEDAETIIKEANAKAKNPPKKSKKTKVAAPGKPKSDGYFDAENAQAYLDFYGYTPEGWRTNSDEAGDTAFVSPDGTVDWDPPVPSPEREAKSRGMKGRKGKRAAAPPTENASDDAASE